MNKLYKKLSVFASFALAAAMLAGCGSETAEEGSSETTAATAVSQEQSSLASLESGNAVIPTVSLDSFDFTENDALAFTRDMKIGWNLGNTFDAVDENNSVADDMTLESAWCGTKTTKELIDNMKNAGFNTIRFPISWRNHVDESFTIKAEYLDRIQEVVDYIIDNDMYCIINTHHDIDKNYYYPDSENIEISTKYIQAIWTQVSERFGEYDNKLIFEGMNEPRLKGTGLEWNVQKTNETSLDSVESINKLNQTFVDTVRASGGNNAERYLMVPGYAASADGVLIDQFTLPKDTASNKLIVSVHAYTPYNFALANLSADTNTYEWSIDNSSDTTQITSFMDKLYEKYISNGVPVIIGEFGARNKKENLQSRVDFAAYYIAAARARGITCCWWDNGAFYGTGENFGLFDRGTVSWKYPDIVLSMMEYAE